MNNAEIKIIRDDAKSVSRIFYFDGVKKSHLGDVRYDTNEFVVCPDLENEKEVGEMSRLLSIFSDAMAPKEDSPGILLVVL